MPNNIAAIEDYTFKETDCLLIDANIWIYLYGPQGKNDRKTKAYSNALKRILSAKSKLLVNVLILSEFVNRYARLEYENWTRKQNKPGTNFKSFRGHLDYRPIAEAILVSIKKILGSSKRISTGFEIIDVDNLLISFDNQKLDFNDVIIANLCKEKGLILVTHDGDFAGSDITVLTANHTLLSTSAGDKEGDSDSSEETNPS